MFTTDLVVRRLIGTKNTWQLKEPLVWIDDICGEVIVPRNFIFDFASVPKVFWNIIPPEGDAHDRAAALHDWCYATHLCGDGDKGRKKCDDMFYRAMLYDGVPKWRAKLMYWAVRLFGGSHFDADSETRHKLAKFISQDEIKLA